MAKKDKAEPTMMLGTDGKFDYIVIGGQGLVALGIKPNIVMPGGKMGHPDTTYFGARLRSAQVDGKEYIPQPPSPFTQKSPDSLNGAWPGIEWEKADERRASTTIGGLIRGRVDGSKEQVQQLITALKTGEVAKQLVNYLFEIAGAQHMHYSAEELIELLDARVYLPLAHRLEKSLAINGAIEEQIEGSIGTFQMQAKLLKDALKKAEQEVPDIEDQDDGEDA